MSLSLGCVRTHKEQKSANALERTHFFFVAVKLHPLRYFIFTSLQQLNPPRNMCTPTTAMARRSQKTQKKSASCGQTTAMDSNSQWQSPQDDLQDRRRMILCIRKLMRVIITQSEYAHKIPVMSKKVEYILYRLAPNKEVYLDRNTVKNRIRCVARALEKFRS